MKTNKDVLKYLKDKVDNDPELKEIYDNDLKDSFIRDVTSIEPLSKSEVRSRLDEIIDIKVKEITKIIKIVGATGKEEEVDKLIKLIKDK